MKKSRGFALPEALTKVNVALWWMKSSRNLFAHRCQQAGIFVYRERRMKHYVHFTPKVWIGNVRDPQNFRESSAGRMSWVLGKEYFLPGAPTAGERYWKMLAEADLQPQDGWALVNPSRLLEKHPYSGLWRQALAGEA